jgi:hypothetical protein
VGDNVSCYSYYKERKVLDVITSFNPENKVQFEMYSHLFAKAYADLDKANKLTENEKKNGRFTSLDEYFAHMADLYSININYIMLPLDEGTEGVFKIDANARTITIPAQFSKCAAVVSDEMCEIAVFTIDRYYDFQDLDRVSICVQWTNAAGEEGISHIQLKDLETFPGKLRFGWPLTSDITKAAGPVQFAVRFYKGVEDAEGKTKYHYLLNTLTNTIVIKPSLTIDNPVIEEENVSSLFASFIANSMNPSYPAPVTPFFVLPGQDLLADGETEPGYGAIGADNTLTMTAQAVANDLGIINYSWKFIPADSDGIPENIVTYPVDEVTGELGDPIVKAGYEVLEVWEKLDPQPESRDGCQKYYTEKFDENGEKVGYELYIDDVFPAEKDLFINKTALKILDTEDQMIVGQYYVEATNTVSVNTTSPSPSSKCAVPAPNDPVISEGKDLPAHKFTDAVAKTTTLGITLVNDPHRPAYTYQWKSTDVDPENDLAKLSDILEGGSEATYTVSEPGWYALHTDSKLNRRIKGIDSAICKVTHLPTAPQVTAMYYCEVPNNTPIDTIREFINGSEETFTWNKIDDYETEKLQNITYGSYVLMKIDTDLDALNPLYTEELTYAWMIQTPEGETRPLNESDCDPLGNGYVHEAFGLGSKVLVARHIKDNFAHNYHCEITNRIQSESKTTDTSNIYTFTII